MEPTIDEYFELMKAQNPWEVKVDETPKGAADQIREFTKGNTVLKDIVARLLSELKTFPPNSDHFTKPGRSLANGGLWYTVTEGHFSFELKVQYRLWEKMCWIIEARLKVKK